MSHTVENAVKTTVRYADDLCLGWRTFVNVAWENRAHGGHDFIATSFLGTIEPDAAIERAVASYNATDWDEIEDPIVEERFPWRAL